jgi:hypothetical protein
VAIGFVAMDRGVSNFLLGGLLWDSGKVLDSHGLSLIYLLVWQ